MTMGIDGTNAAAREDETSATATGDDNDRRAERAVQPQASTNDTRSRPRAETLTREQYADAMRADGSPMSRDNSPDNRQAREGGTPGQPERHAGQPADHDRAEPRDRETYPDDSRADPAGTRHRPDENGLVSSGAGPEGDQPGGLIADADQGAISAQDQRGADLLPETITFENKDVEITHNAADGIWIEGLPGEPPTRIGDILTSPGESGRSRIESFREELTKDADDLVDMGGKWTDLLRDTLGTPPPTNSMTHNRGPEITATRPEHGIDAGHGAEALLTLAIVGAATVHKLHERWQQAWHH